MKLRTQIGYIAQVRPGYIIQSTERNAMKFTSADEVRAFLRDHAAILPFGVELVS